jgi:prolyl 4-hydroxylase
MSEAAETIVDRAQALVVRGRLAEAYRMLTDAADSGNGLAAFTLGQWRLSGDLIRRDLALCRAHFGRAAALGIQEAEPIYLALLANGAGGIPRQWQAVLETLAERAPKSGWAAEQLHLLRLMALDKDGNPATALSEQSLRARPHVRTISQFLSAEECVYLMRVATPSLRPSVVVHPTTGALVQDSIRTSSAAAFPFVLESPVLHAINRRIAAATRTTYAQGEPLQVLRYEPGQQYKMHSDAIPGEANQRTCTLLAYLNDDYEGGETCFPDADLSFRGQAGDALIFANVLPDGRPDPAARHAGLPIRRGSKFLLSKWIRKLPLDLRGPPGRPF